jgi:hypothetical protein
MTKYLTMVAEFKEIVRPYAEEPLTKQIILNLLKGYKRPYDKIHELVKKGELIQLKRGIYIPGPKVNVEKPGSFLLANHLWGPSYISLETALSYWGLIPERVFEITSITLKIAKTYKTPVGRFSYLHAELPYYAFGIERVQLTKKQAVLMATPEKALCDKIVMTPGVFLRSAKQVWEFLIEDIRIEEETLQRLKIEEIRAWLEEAPKRSSLHMLVKTLEKI